MTAPKRTPRTPKNAHAAELVALESLKPYPGNARTHDLPVIRESLRVNGQYRPVVVRAKTRHVLAGNGTLEAARAEGWAEVWATFVDCDAKAAKRINLVDNRANDLAGWDEQLLAAQLGELPGVEGTGWSERELVSFVANVNGPGEDTEPGEPPKVPRTKVGDLWVLGEHRLLCGDATSPDAVAALLGDAKPVALVTDPPYCSGGFQEAGKRGGSIGTRGDEMIANDTLSTRGYMALIKAILALAPCGLAYVFTDWRMWVNLFDAVESSGYGVRNMIVWDKGSPGMGVGWRSQHELVMCAMRMSQPFNPKKAQGNVIAADRTGNPLHATQKPVELLETILDVSDIAPTVYDPLAGSGSTLIACENLSRRCYAMEIDPGYCDVIVDRWERHAGRKATRART